MSHTTATGRTAGWRTLVRRLWIVCAATIVARTLMTPVAAAQPAVRQSSVVASHDSQTVEHLLTVTHVHLLSSAFHTTRDVSVWLPDGAPSTTRYVVLIFPDAEEKGQFRAALANIQFLVDRKLIPPMLVVGVPYLANRRHELTPAATGSTAQLYPAAGGADQTIRFIADELLPWVDAHYPTLPTRVLAGHSLGGLFALYTMVTRPEVFRIVIAMSPVLSWNDGALSSDVAARLAGDRDHPRTLFLTSGGLEPSIDQPTTEFTRRLTALLDSAHSHGLRFERRRYPSDIHEMTPLPSLVDGLRLAFDPILVPIDSVVGDLAAHHVQDPSEIETAAKVLQSRYAAGAAALGIPGQFPEAPLDELGGYSLDVKQVRLGVRLLRENRDRYPASSNAHESLGEALMAAGDTAGAVGELRTAVTIATGELQKPGSVITLAHERDVKAAALAQLQALHRDQDASIPR